MVVWVARWAVRCRRRLLNLLYTPQLNSVQRSLQCGGEAPITFYPERTLGEKGMPQLVPSYFVRFRNLQ